MSGTQRSTIRVDGTPYRAVLAEGPRNWSAHIPALPGLVVTGATRTEVRQRLVEAAAFHLEGLRRREAVRHVHAAGEPPGSADGFAPERERASGNYGSNLR